jgi:hypothetical protein
MCNTRLCASTWSSLSRQASDTRKPWRNIRSKRQRSRASLRMPRVTAISFPTAYPVRWLRSALLRAAFVFLAVFRLAGSFIVMWIVGKLNVDSWQAETLKKPYKPGFPFSKWTTNLIKCTKSPDGRGLRCDQGGVETD